MSETYKVFFLITIIIWIVVMIILDLRHFWTPKTAALYAFLFFVLQAIATRIIDKSWLGFTIGIPLGLILAIGSYYAQAAIMRLQGRL